MKKQAEKAQKIVEMLNDKNGFDRWWRDIDHEVKEEIIKEISLIIKEREKLLPLVKAFIKKIADSITQRLRNLKRSKESND